MSVALRTTLATIRCEGDAFWFQGRRHGPVEGAPIEEALADTMYGSVHCRMPLRGSAHHGFSNWVGSRRFVDRLSAANTGSGTWQAGWLVQAFEPDGRVVVERNGVRFWTPPADCRPGEGSLEVGGEVLVRLAKEYREMVPGFYLAVGDEVDRRATTPTVRVYWNVSPRGAEQLMALLTRWLNRERVPFQLKILAEPLRFDRCDTAVLYLPLEYLVPSAPVFRRVYSELRPWLRSLVSHLVKPLGHGVGLACDPGDGSSFGEHRTRLLAKLILVHGTDPSLAALSRELDAMGYDLDALYLNPGSGDEFGMILGESR